MSSESVLRTFVAVDVSEESRQALLRVQERLRPLCPGISWVRPEHMHLTLLFLGATPSERIGDLGRTLDRALNPHRPFTYQLRGMGWFGPPRHPRVLWAGVTEDGGRLHQLHYAVVDAARTLHLVRPDDPPYVPHLTLGRVRRGRPEHIQRLMKELDTYGQTDFGTNPVHGVHLFASTLTPQGPIYRILHTVPLGGELRG